jgi:hypothetical protein
VLSERADQVAWDGFAPADWDLFAQMADREGVAPLMYWKLKDSPVVVPPSTFNFLRSTYYQTLAQNTLIYQELERILNVLDDASIPAIVLKGAALAATVYEDIGLRPMGDLDLLVPREELSNVVTLLNGVGFGRNENIERRPGLDRIIKHHFALAGGPQNHILLEIHWNLIAGDSDWRSPTLEWFWNQREQSESMGSRGLTSAIFSSLSPTAHALYLSSHLMLQHGGSEARLVWLFDLYLLICMCDNQIDWDVLISRAEDYGWSYALYKSLLSVSECFDRSLPLWRLESVLEGKDNKSRWMVDKKANLHQPRVVRYITKISSLNGIAKLNFLVSVLFPTPKFMMDRYKIERCWILPFYYLYRWMDMLVDSFHILKNIRKSQ